MQWQLQATEPLSLKWHPISGKCLFFGAWDSKYLVSIQPRRHCDHRWHNGFPDEERAQLLSLNKISQFPLHPSTMALAWLLIEFLLSRSYNSSRSHALSPPSTASSRLHPSSWGKGERFYYSGDLSSRLCLSVFLSSSPPLPPIIVSLCSFPPFFISPHIAWQLASWHLRTQSIESISGYFSSLSLSYWCGRHLYEPGLTAAAQTGCQGAALIMRDFEEVLLRESQGGSFFCLTLCCSKRAQTLPE